MSLSPGVHVFECSPVMFYKHCLCDCILFSLLSFRDVNTNFTHSVTCQELTIEDLAEAGIPVKERRALHTLLKACPG